MPKIITPDEVDALLAKIGADVETIGADVTVVARAVAAKRAAFVAALTALVGLGDTFGLSHVWGDKVSAWSTAVFAVAAVLGAGSWIHTAVTPADPALVPTDSSGRVLVSADTAKAIALNAVKGLVSGATDDSAPAAPVDVDDRDGPSPEELAAAAVAAAQDLPVTDAPTDAPEAVSVDPGPAATPIGDAVEAEVGRHTA